MTWIELFLLALTLSMDTFAVSAGGSPSLGRMTLRTLLKVASVFALVQGTFTLLGWLGGHTLYRVVSVYDHWIAFILLAYIGIKMIADGISGLKTETACDKEETSVNLLSFKTLLLASVATSIDALAVGVTMAVAVRQSYMLWGGIAMITLVTGVVSVLGLLFGCSMGNRFGARAQVAGGAVLLCIGIKVLLEHTVFS